MYPLSEFERVKDPNLISAFTFAQLQQKLLQLSAKDRKWGFCRLKIE